MNEGRTTALQAWFWADPYGRLLMGTTAIALGGTLLALWALTPWFPWS